MTESLVTEYSIHVYACRSTVDPGLRIQFNLSWNFLILGNLCTYINVFKQHVSCRINIMHKLAIYTSKQLSNSMCICTEILSMHVYVTTSLVETRQ